MQINNVIHDYYYALDRQGWSLETLISVRSAHGMFYTVFTNKRSSFCVRRPLVHLGAFPSQLYVHFIMPFANHLRYLLRCIARYIRPERRSVICVNKHTERLFLLYFQRPAPISRYLYLLSIVLGPICRSRILSLK